MLALSFPTSVAKISSGRGMKENRTSMIKITQLMCFGLWALCLWGDVWTFNQIPINIHPCCCTLANIQWSTQVANFSVIIVFSFCEQSNFYSASSLAFHLIVTLRAQFRSSQVDFSRSRRDSSLSLFFITSYWYTEVIPPSVNNKYLSHSDLKKHC